MSLIDTINNNLKESIKGKDKLRTETLRGLKSAIRYAEIEAGATLDETGVLGVIARQAKQRRDSIAEFEKGQRADLVAKEAAELAILEEYLPAQLSAAEIKTQAQAIITELGVTDARGMGQVMKRLMDDLKGQADGKIVSQIVRQLLSR
ncbi:MAG: GatB/YqeY domain-containing protein [Chloroflexota bacterium]